MNPPLMISDERSISLLATSRAHRYGSPVAANSVTGRRGPMSKRRNSAPITIAGAFFVPAVTCYGGCAWEDFGPAGILLPRSANPRTAATLHCFAATGGSSSAKGATPMPALNPSAIRAFAHRRMALSALRANSSVSVRLARYNAHMAIVRTLESVGGAA